MTDNGLVKNTSLVPYAIEFGSEGIGQVDSALSFMAGIVYTTNRENGWFDEDRTFGDDIALLHSEVSEMFEAYRDSGLEDQTKRQHTWEAGYCTVCSIASREWIGESCLNTSAAPTEEGAKPEGVGSEAADILVRLLDTCKRHDIDLAFEFFRKVSYNKTRGYKHGNKRV